MIVMIDVIQINDIVNETFWRTCFSSQISLHVEPYRPSLESISFTSSFVVFYHGKQQTYCVCVDFGRISVYVFQITDFKLVVWCENTGLCDAPSAASAVV